MERAFGIVTGSSRGIGAALALQLAAEGLNVVVNYVSDSSADSAAAIAEKIKNDYSVDAVVVQASVSSEEDCKKIVQTGVDTFGTDLAVLINNAGISGKNAPFVEQDMADDAHELGVDLLGVMEMTRLCIPYMVKRGGGHIVNISSVAALMGSWRISYSAAKAGVIGVTKSLALEYAKENIMINAICPGMYATDMVLKAPAEARERYAAQIPVGRFGELEDLQNLCHYLINSNYMTGQAISPNGGMYV